MEYKFIKFNRYEKRGELKVSPHRIHIGKTAYEKLGNPEYIAVFIDSKNNIVKLTVGTKEDWKVTNNNGYASIGTSGVGRELAIGKYSPMENNLFTLKEKV